MIAGKKYKRVKIYNDYIFMKKAILLIIKLKES